MSSDRKRSRIKGKLRAFSSTSHLRDLVRAGGSPGQFSESVRSVSPPPPIPQLYVEKASSQNSRQGSGSTSIRGTSATDRNDYSYLIRERHSADADLPDSAPLSEQPQAGQPFSFQGKSAMVGASDGAITATAPSFPLPAFASRQSHGGIGGNSTGAPVRPATSHQVPVSLLRRAGSTIPRSTNRDLIDDESGPSTGLVPPASKWFKRGRLRTAGRHQQTASNGYQLDMNFSDLNNFVDLSRVRRPSVTSSLGTGESASLNAGNAAGDSSSRDGDSSTSLILPDNSSVYTTDRRRLHGSSGSPGPRRSNVTQGSPSLREALAADVRSIASSIRGSKARGSSAGPTLGSEAVATQRPELQAWPSNRSWQQRESSVKSRRPTTQFGDIESECEYEYSGSVGDHGSVQSAPTFEDKQPLMQFTDPWSSDRDRQQPSSLPSTDRRQGGISDGLGKSSNNSLRGPPGSAEQQRDAEQKGNMDLGIDPDLLPRKSEPWAPPESWAVLPTMLDGTEEGGVAVCGVKDPVSDGEGESSDSDLEGDNNLYSLRIYKEDSTFGTFHCRLSTTTAEFMQMAAKKFFIPDITRHCLYMQKANGLDRTLNPTERPANILKKYLEQMGYRPEDNITLQGREDNSYLCKFSLFKAAIPRVSPNMEVEVSSFHYVELRARKLQTVPVFLYAHANKIVSLNMSKNPGLNFPADFVQLCGNLRELRLSTCQFSRFPTSIQYFPHLTFLDLSGNDMKRMRHAPLNKLVHLTTLMLRNNRLVDLPESLAELQSLQVLNVSNNNLPAFPLVVTKIASLEDLDISLNRIPDIPNAISSLVNLVKLNVMGNSLTGNLSEGLGRLSKLEELDVRQNKLQDFGVTAELAGLKLLYTESNIVTRAHMELTSAVSVSLRSNKLTQCHLTNPAHTLVFLDLSRNQLTELPPDTFVHLPMLEHLVLDSNHIVSIPPSVGNLSNLVRLSCANNILSLIPIELTRLEKLTTLDLHNNNLKLLPPEIWLMPKLAVLSLSSNLLEQFPHPSMLENLRRQQGGSSSVRAVAAAAAAAAAAAQRSGAMKGTAVSRVTQSIQFTAASASSSRQSSPQVRANSESLSEYPEQHSDMALPVGSERIRNKSADAGRLQAQTPTPPIKRYTVSDPPPLSLSLKELRMGDNNLDDEVFTLMAFLPELRVLNLSYNELYDLPPSAMAHMRKITELYLSGTQISTIPEEEPNAAFWRSLRLLNINGNKLQSLPSWLAKIHGLSILDVGSNVLKYNITNWPYDWNWNWNTSLKYLNFSYNERFEIKGAHLHTKAFHDHAKLVGNTQSNGPARDLFNYIAKEPPKSDCVSDFYQLNDLRILGLLQLTIMVPLPDETQNRRVRTTDPIKQVKYGIADTLGREDRVSAWDLATSRFRMVDEECLFGLFHARETGTSSSAISKYLCDNFLYVFREELEKVTEQMHSDEHDSRRHRHHMGSGFESKKAVNFAESSSSAAEENHGGASHLNNEQVQAALRRTFLTLNKDLGTHNRQLIAAAAAAEAYAARSARVSTPSAFGDSNVDGSGPAANHLNRLAVPEFNAPGRGSFDPKVADSVSGDHQGGTTAVVAYIHGRTLHVSNVGDALGVVSRRGTPVMLSKRHDSYDAEEIMRIRSIGGYITQQGKVQGQTDITRAFGYFHLLPYVNADPTINSLQLTEEDEFLILANRPVWDAITPQIAVDIARKHRRDPRLAAARVRDHVIAYGVTNSIMVMVIGFGPMFSKNTGRPMRGFSVRDSIYPGVSDHRAKYALTRRLSRSPSTTISPTFGKRASVSLTADSKGLPGVHPAPGSQQNYPPIPTQHGPYELSDDLDDFLGGHSSRARRQRDRDVNARPGDSTLARLEREVPPPVGEIALVFTDVKNSTIQWETNQVAMRSAIKVHNSTMRRMLRSIGGYEVKTEGDAFIVSFPTVASALHWCLAVQMAFLAADWPQETLDSPHGCPIYWPNDDDNGGGNGAKGISEVEKRRLIYRGLRVRMGVHFGCPVSEEDPVTRRMDYFGPMVNRSARISGAADGGQVYVSQDVMDEVYAILGIFETADLGGITDMHQIIDEPSLARDVQALKTLGLCATPIGEIKLKGLESPEFVSMVYPAALRGRVDMQVQEEERQQQQKQQELLQQQQLQQQQQQQMRKKKQDWSRRESPANASKSPNQRNGKTPAVADSLVPYIPNGQSQRSSMDDGVQHIYTDTGSLGSLSALSSQRSSFSRQAPAQVQRNMRELSMEISTAGGAEIRNRLRQVGDMPLWSAPITRRSISLLQSNVTGPEHLESIVEDGSGTLYRLPDAGTQSVGRGSRDRGARTSGTLPILSPRAPMYVPAYYAYLQGSSGASSSWSKGSSYFSGPTSAAAGFPWQGPVPSGVQVSRSSIDTGTGSMWTGMGSSGGSAPEQTKTVDLLHVDMLYRLLYRLGILAVESDTEAVLPSFEYFVAHQGEDLSSYRIHRASTVSIGNMQHHSAAARCQQPQPLPPHNGASGLSQLFDPEMATSARDGGRASMCARHEGEADDGRAPDAETRPAQAAVPVPLDSPASSPIYRSRSVSPSLVQPTLAAAMTLNRQARSTSPLAQAPLATLGEEPALPEIAAMPEKNAPDMQLSLALNEPPVPLYLTEDMSQQHLVAILAMLVRQLECAVDVLDNRMHVGDVRAKKMSPASARNDSKMDGGISADGAFQNALEQVSKESHGLASAGIEWTKEHVLSALESYLSRLMATHQSEQ
ncbi:cysteinyl-tRNA synthetase [Coemansia sp. IMI 209128]|nr:cysteinyl-tRNA synthetase [Coemansia sp. IMI 209128]